MAIKTPQDLIDYIMETPYNANPNILRSALSGMEGGGSLEGDYNWDEAHKLALYQEGDTSYFFKEDIDIIKNRLPHLIIFINPDESRDRLILVKSFNDGNDFRYVFQDSTSSHLEKDGSQIIVEGLILTLNNDRYVSDGR